MSAPTASRGRGGQAVTGRGVVTNPIAANTLGLPQPPAKGGSTSDRGPGPVAVLPIMTGHERPSTRKLATRNTAASWAPCRADASPGVRPGRVRGCGLLRAAAAARAPREVTDGSGCRCRCRRRAGSGRSLGRRHRSASDADIGRTGFRKPGRRCRDRPACPTSRPATGGPTPRRPLPARSAPRRSDSVGAKRHCAPDVRGEPGPVAVAAEGSGHAGDHADPGPAAIDQQVWAGPRRVQPGPHQAIRLKQGGKDLVGGDHRRPVPSRAVRPAASAR